MHQLSLRKALLPRLTGRIFVPLIVVILTWHQAAADPSIAAVGSSPSASRYTLVGIARFEGISYASLLDQQTGDHFLLSTDKKSEFDVALASVRTDDDPSGPGAIILKDNVSVLIKLESELSVASSDSSTPAVVVGQPYPAQKIPRPGSARAGALEPPNGGKLPLVFQEVDPQKMTLTDEQKATLKQLRQDFINAVNGPGATSPTSNAKGQTSASSPGENAGSTATATSTPTTSDQQLQNWTAAQEHSDEMFRMLYGYQAFNAYTESSSYPTGP
jgi:hypothetical protein